MATPQPKKGETVRYRALAGDLYDAIVMGSPEPGFVAVNIQCHPNRPDDLLFLSSVALDPKARGAAWPKGAK